MIPHMDRAGGSRFLHFWHKSESDEKTAAVLGVLISFVQVCKGRALLL